MFIYNRLFSPYLKRLVYFSFFKNLTYFILNVNKTTWFFYPIDYFFHVISFK